MQRLIRFFVKYRHMTPKFDLIYEQLINELLTPQAKRREQKSRYWSIGKAGLSGDVRGVQSLKHKGGQKSKLGNQQYVGNGINRIRRRNISKKSADEIGVANGIGGHLKIDGINPKEPGAVVNSKQGDMEIKYHLGNNRYKVGPRIKRDYTRIHSESRENKHGIKEWIDVAAFRDNDNALYASDILDIPDLFSDYPYLSEIEIELAKDSHPMLNGEPARCQTLGGGEAFIYLNIKYCADGLNKTDADQRKHVEQMILHELCHVTQDYEDRMDTYNTTGTQSLEDEANNFAMVYLSDNDYTDICHSS